MEYTTLKDAFAIVHVAVATATLVLGLRIIVGEVIPGLTQLKRLFTHKRTGLAQIIIERAGAFLERIKLFLRGFAAVWMLLVVVTSEVLPSIYMLVTEGGSGLVHYYRSLPAGSVLLLLVGLAPAIVIYLLPNILERYARKYFERYARQMRAAYKKYNAQSNERGNKPPRIEQ